MSDSMVGTTEPENIEWAGVVIVMSVGAVLVATVSRAGIGPNENATVDSALDCQMCGALVRIAGLPCFDDGGYLGGFFFVALTAPAVLAFRVGRRAQTVRAAEAEGGVAHIHTI